MMTYQHCPVPARVGSHLYALLAYGRATLHTWQQHRRERYDLRCLLCLDDRQLADIGLQRWSVAWEASKPFWRP